MLGDCTQTIPATFFPAQRTTRKSLPLSTWLKLGASHSHGPAEVGGLGTSPCRHFTLTQGPAFEDENWEVGGGGSTGQASRRPSLAWTWWQSLSLSLLVGGAGWDITQKTPGIKAVPVSVSEVEARKCQELGHPKEGHYPMACLLLEARAQPQAVLLPLPTGLNCRCLFRRVSWAEPELPP